MGADGMGMRKLYFLLPGTSGRFACGGLWAELSAVELAGQICPAEVVTYQQREPNTLYLEDVLTQPSLKDIIFVVSWGFHVPKLVQRLRHAHVLYHAHSAGYGFRLPANVPILTVSRNTMSYWGQVAPNALIYHLPNAIAERFHNQQQERNIDVLVQSRKSSQYLLNTLVPVLQAQCRVVLLDAYVEDIVGLFNRAKVYLYDSAEYWAMAGLTEGFGLPPMEAMACGCQVFASVNGALADYLDPGFNCDKIGVYSQSYDVQRILQAVHSPRYEVTESFFAPYRTAQLLPRLEQILTEVNTFFDHVEQTSGDIPGLNRGRLWRLKLQQIGQKIRKRLKK